MQAKHHQSKQSGTHKAMGSPASTSSRMTPGYIRRRIKAAKITDIDKEVLEVELDGLLNVAHLSVEEAAKWMTVSIQVRESTMSERAEVDREIEEVFASKRS